MIPAVVVVCGSNRLGADFDVKWPLIIYGDVQLEGVSLWPTFTLLIKAMMRMRYSLFQFPLPPPAKYRGRATRQSQTYLIRRFTDAEYRDHLSPVGKVMTTFLRGKRRRP